MRKENIHLIVILIIVALLSGALSYGDGYNAGKVIGYSEKNNESDKDSTYQIATAYDVGWRDGINYQAQVDTSNIVLGLINIPSSGYYIVNKNYGNFKLNTTDQTEALKYLQKEISLCL